MKRGQPSLTSQRSTGPPEIRAVLFVLSMGTVWEARLSPCCDGGTKKKGKPDQRERRPQAHVEKASKAVAAGHGAPKTPTGPARDQA